MNREFFYRVYAKIEHQIAPKLKYAQYIYEEVLGETLHNGAAWLDIGCGHHILPAWRDKAEADLVQKAGFLVGLDYDLPSLVKHRSIRIKVRGDVSKLPFRENTFDLVTANMVVEHLEEPEIQFAEIYRVLKPGGVFVFHTPNALGYTTVFARMIPESLKGGLIKLLDGRPSEDVFKTHYQANTENHIRSVAKKSQLQVANIGYVASSAKFAVVAPVAFFELLWIRLLLTHPFRKLRTNLIVKLAKST